MHALFFFEQPNITNMCVRNERAKLVNYFRVFFLKFVIFLVKNHFLMLVLKFAYER